MKSAKFLTTKKARTYAAQRQRSALGAADADPQAARASARSYERQGNELPHKSCKIYRETRPAKLSRIKSEGFSACIDRTNVVWTDLGDLNMMHFIHRKNSFETAENRTLKFSAFFQSVKAGVA